MSIRRTLDQRTSWVLATLTAALWAAVVLSGFWNNWPPDLSAIYFASHFYGTGQAEFVYASPEKFFGSDFPPAWGELRAQIADPDNEVFPFVYPPIWAAVLAPIVTSMAPQTFFNGVLVVHTAMLIASVFLAYRLVRPPMPVFVWAIVSFAVFWMSAMTSSALVHNQPQITVAFLTILALERFRAGHSGSAGAVLALAATLKISPIIFAVLFVAERDWRAFGVCAVVGGAITAASFAIAGPDLHWEFLDKLAIISEQVAVMRVNWSAEAVLYLLHAWGEGLHPLFTNSEGQGVAMEPGWIRFAVLLTLAIGMGWIIGLSRVLTGDLRLQVLPLAIAVVVTVTSPLSWTHHYLVPLFLSPVLFCLWPQRTAAVVFLAFAALTSLPLLAYLSVAAMDYHLAIVAGVAGVTLLLFATLLSPPVRQVRRESRGVPAE